MSSKKRSLLQSFMSSSVGTIISKAFGLLRELVLSGILGAGMVYDSFIIAWTFPGVIRRFVADEGLTGALMPAVGNAEEESIEEAKRLASQTLGALIVACVALSVVGIVAAPMLVQWMAPSFKDEQLALTISLSQVLFPFVIFVSVLTWMETLVNLKEHYFWPKVAPAMVSLCVVGAAFLFRGGSAIDIIWAISYATIVGGFLQLVLCFPALKRLWGIIPPSFSGFANPRFQDLLAEMGKVALIGIAAKINIIVLRYLASTLEEGAMTWYWNATRLVDFAQGIIAVGMASVLLPKIVKAVANKDGDAFREHFGGASRLASALLIPFAAFLVFFAEPFVAVLLRHGRYAWSDVQQTATAVQLLAPFMLAVGGINIIKKPFYALDRRDVLLGVGICGVGLTFALGSWLCPEYGVNGLAAALSLSTLIQLAAYMIIVRGLIPGGLGIPALLKYFAIVALASIPSIGLGLLLLPFGDWEAGFTIINIVVLGGIAGVGGIAYVVTATILKVPEIDSIVQKFRRKLGV